MEISLLPWRDLTDEDRRRLDALSALLYPPGHPDRDITWAPVEPDRQWAVVVREDGTLVSYVGIMRRRVLADGEPREVAGIRSVKTDPAHRGRGLATQAMQRAAAFIDDELGVELSVLWSAQLAVPLYERLGWVVFEGAVLCEQPGGRARCDEMLPGSRFMLRWRGEPRTIAQLDLHGAPW